MSNKKAENAFETFLFNSRFVVFLAVIGSLLAAVMVFVMSTWQVIVGVGTFLHIFNNVEESESLIAILVSSIDEYLFATVLLIFSMGLYELFISKLDPASRKPDSRPNWLKINTIDDLKLTLGKVILMILIVSFFRHSLDIKFDSPLDLVLLGVGIILIAGALYLTHLFAEKVEEKE
jgi:uncharacterized protein (TIGR00645 family)